MYDVISIGDTTTDVFLQLKHAVIKCEDHDEEECSLCMSFANKIPVTRVTHLYGVGNAANAAVGFNRLGLSSAIYTVVGNDYDGIKARKVLEQEGVDTRYLKIDRLNRTNYSAVLNFDGERTILIYHEKRQYKLPKFKKTQWIYFTSLAEGHEVLHKPLVDYVKKTRAKLAFNPGTFQLKEGLKVLKPIIEVSEVMFLNKQEAQSLLKKKAKITVLLKELHSIGTKIIVITDGPKGSYCYDGKKIYHLGIFDTPVIERTGAGDAYGIAFVASLILIRDIKLAMTYGTFNSSSVVQHVGAQKGLLNREDMLKMVEKYPNASPEIYKG